MWHNGYIGNGPVGMNMSMGMMMCMMETPCRQ